MKRRNSGSRGSPKRPRIIPVRPEEVVQPEMMPDNIMANEETTEETVHFDTVTMVTEAGELLGTTTDEISREEEDIEGSLHIASDDTAIVIGGGGDASQMISTGGTIEEQVATTLDDTTNTLEMSVAEEQVEEQQLEGDSEYQNLIIQHMDIAEPLTTLRKLLELRLQCSLIDHEFYLQDTIRLDPSKNLTTQCVQGTGIVQINLEVKSQSQLGMKPRLNIIDILKPAEEIDASTIPSVSSPPPKQRTNTKVVIPFSEEADNVTRWIVDQNYRREQERLNIPTDPMLWNAEHVRHWIKWAIKQFSLEDVDLESFNLSGAQLCELKHGEFVKYIPNDKGDIFWTHLELLRKCKFVAVIQTPTPHAITTITVSSGDADLGSLHGKNFSRKPKAFYLPSDNRLSPGNRTGNNGQIQLWQFLLELLTDKDCREVIQWIGEDGEFKLNNPEVVAQMWGQRKNKPTMNYEKLSRALRYYYDGDMISKVHGKRFVYKFVCDFRTLIGYSAAELSRLVNECADKKLQRVRETYSHGKRLSVY